MNDNRDDNGQMDNLLNRIQGVAREEDTAIAGYATHVTPLSVETRGRITDLILAQQAREKVKTPAMDELALHRRLRSRRAFSVAAVGIGAAAAALMFWVRPDAEGTALPGYVVMASGGVMDVRGGAPGATQDEGPVAPTQRVRAQTELLVTCRPETAVVGQVAARAFLVDGANGSPKVSEVRPRVRVATTGAVELRVAGSDLLGRGGGRATLRVVVGRPDALRAVDGRAAVNATGGDGIRWLAVPLDVEPSTP